MLSQTAQPRDKQSIEQQETLELRDNGNKLRTLHIFGHTC